VCFIQLGRIVLIAGELCNVRSSRGCGIALRPIFTPREPARRARKMRDLYNVRALAHSLSLTAAAAGCIPARAIWPNYPND
jgi:hypothetical protein